MTPAEYAVIELARGIASGAPKKRSFATYMCNVPWEKIERLRELLKELDA